MKQYNKSFEDSRMGESWETDKNTMPVLIKLIDANDILSVQVHPNDEMALELENEPNGKTEAWIVLECDEGAELIAGIKSGTNQLQLEEAICHGGIEQLLNIVKVKKGDCIFIPAGTVHSLGKGMLVYEVQQPSDLTYRLYDWGRTDEKGKPRELHIQKALKSMEFDISEVNTRNIYEIAAHPGCMYDVFQTQYFQTSYFRLEKAWEYCILSNCFTALTVISGSGCICFKEEKEAMAKGDTWIIPKGCEITLRTIDDSEFIITEDCQTFK